ncbi:MAG TPA: thymidylate synthase [Candidatus Nanoarchaeia archaeon]|nr:thymidylate synthase [Candidatus Nanoarchaeia archaeon]
MTLLFKENMILGNEESPTSICCLWAMKENYSKIDKKLYRFTGNLYSFEGINILLRNIFLNPSIRNIIVVGPDLNGTGETLLNFFKNGVDENNKIIGSNFIIQNNIGKEYLEKLRQNVKIYDFRKSSIVELEKKLQELSIKAVSFMDEKSFPEIKLEVETLPCEKSGFIIRQKTIAHAWLQILDTILKFGEIKKTPFGMKQKEILNALVVVDAEDKSIEEWLNFTDEELQKYLPTILTAEKPATIHYTYGSRIFRKEDKFDIDQVTSAINELRSDPHSRRAVVFTWRVDEDMTSKQPPCLTQITWNIQEGRLFQTVVFRSHDMYAGWPMNLFALRKLQEKVSSELIIPAGPLTCLSQSAHIYENNWKEVDEVLNKYYVHNRKFNIFTLDPRGSFVVNIVDGEITVQHYTTNSVKTSYFFRGKNIKEIFGQIMNANLISRLDHAYYLGRELRKAYECIRHNREYKQDSEN